MGVLDLIAQTAIGEVEAGGLTWQIRALRSDLVRGLRYHLLHVRLPTEEDLIEEAAVATHPEADRPAERARIAARRAREALSVERLAEAEARDAEIVCAAVVAVRDEAGAWAKVTITAPGTAADPAVPSMPVDQLPSSVVALVSKAAWDLSTDGGEAAARIRSFRGGS